MSLAATVTSGGTPLAGVQEIEVLESLGEPARYRVRLPAAVLDGDLPVLADPLLDPGAVLDVTTGGQPVVKGPVTGHRARLVGDSESSWLDVLGGDRLLELAAAERVAVWSGTPSDAVSAIVAGYGLTADVAATGTTYGPDSHELLQRGSDLDFVRRLARRHGHLLWLSRDPAGLETAHFRPPPVDGPPVTTLALHLPAAALDEVHLMWDTERPTRAVVAGLDTASVQPVDASLAAPPLPAMAATGLAAVAGDRPALLIGPGDDHASLVGPATAALGAAELFVRATAATTVGRVGAVLHAHAVVVLDGLGRRHSGAWLVAGVRHLIDAVAHRMELTLVRNGWEV